MNTAMLLEMAAEGMPGRIAVGSQSDGISYGELLDRARRTAGLIAESGAERVGFVGTNSEILPVLVYATAIAGVPFVPVNYRLTDERLRSVVSRIAPALVVADAESDRIEGIEGVEVIDRLHLEDHLARSPRAEESVALPDEPAVWLFTSGTTGEPKAAVLRHRHLAAYVFTTLEFMSAEPDQATLVSVPPYHIAGLAAVLSSTYVGRRIVYLPQFDPKEWVEVAGRERVTHAMVVPTMLGRILDTLEESGSELPSLTHLSYGGGRMPMAIVERAMTLLPGVGFVNAYGLTETSSTIAVLDPEDHRVAFASEDQAARERLGSVGRPLPTIELEIRDSEGIALPAGQSGEIYVRGEQIAGEYEGRSALTDAGWFGTNDAGHLDSAGFLFVEGRLDDVIVRGGENISPGEIESVLLEHPGVRDAAVVGVPDDEWGECPAAAVVLESRASVSPIELHRWVADRLRSTRAPVVVQVHDELPHSETGKLLRRVLREELADASRLTV
ncbi:MAG: class I adenylate-forming enzyme family protein [Acidimicrobiales bacterium]